MGSKDFATVAGELETCSRQHCESVLCFDDVRAVLRDDWISVKKNAVGVKDGEAKKIQM